MIKRKTYLLLVAIISILQTGCYFDDTYENVCTGKYSVTKFKDSIYKRYKIEDQNIDFSQVHKAPVFRRHKCDTIYLEISTDSIPVVYSDTFALSLSKIFFSDTLNKDVHSLHLTLNGYWSVKFNANENWRNARRTFIKYRVDRDSIGHYSLSNTFTDNDSMGYTIESERFVGEKIDKGLCLTVKVKQDYKNIILLADQIKEKYRPVIDGKQLSSLLINMTVDSLTCRLCSEKSYEFSYHFMEYTKR